MTNTGNMKCLSNLLLRKVTLSVLFICVVQLSALAVIRGKAVQNDNLTGNFCVGDTVHISIDTAWTAATSYQWQICTNQAATCAGPDWTDIPSESTETLEFVLTSDMPAIIRFRCRYQPVANFTTILQIYLEHPVASITAPLTNTVCVDEQVPFNSTFLVNPDTTAANPTLNWYVGTSNVSSGSSSTFNHTFSNTSPTSIKLIATSQAGCSDTVSVSVTAIAAPVVNAGTNVHICNNATVPLNGSVTGSNTSTLWTIPLGAGGITNSSNLTTAVFDPSASSGSVIVTLEVNSSACPVVTDTMTVYISAPPTVNAGEGVHICSGSVAQLAGMIGGGPNTGTTWTAPSGEGTFTNANSLSSASFDPETSNGSVLITLEVSSQYCALVTDTMHVYVIPPPIVNAGPSQHVCSNDNADLNGSVSGGPNSGTTWSNPDNAGAFTNITNPSTATFNPAANDGSVILNLTATSAYCPTVTDSMTLYIDPSPEMILIPDTVCSGDAASVIPSSTLGNGLQFNWTATSSSVNISFGPTSGSGSIDQVISTSELTNGFVTYTYTPVSNQSCPGLPTPVQVVVIAAPTVTTFASSDSELCDGEQLVVDLHFSGDGPFNYVVTDASNNNYIDQSIGNNTTFTLTPDVSTTYHLSELTGSGAFACNASILNTTLDVVVHDVATAVLSAEDDTFCSNTGAEVTLTMTGGAAPFDGTINVSQEGDFDFQNADATVDIQFQASVGTNTIEVTELTDANGCSPILTGINTIDIVVMAAPTAVITSSSDVLCGNEDLVLEITGTVNGLVTYNVNTQQNLTAQINQTPYSLNLGQFAVGSDVQVELEQIDLTINDVTCSSHLVGLINTEIIAFPNTTSIVMDTTASPFCQGSQDLAISLSSDLPSATWSWTSIPFVPIAFNENGTNAWLDVPSNLTGNLQLIATATVITGAHECSSSVTETVHINTADAPDVAEVILHPINNTLVVLMNDPSMHFQWGQTDPETYMSTISNGETAQDWIVGTLDPDMLYWVLITDENTGCSTMSYYGNSTPILIDDPQTEDVMVFPNPASSSVQLASQHLKEVEFVRILNSNGAIVFERSFLNKNQLTIDVSNLAAGLYTLVAKTSEQKWSVSKIQIISQH